MAGGSPRIFNPLGESAEPGRVVEPGKARTGRQNLPIRSREPQGGAAQSGATSGDKLHRNAIDAVAQSRGLWPVFKHMAEMASAAAAMHLGARQQQDMIGGSADRIRQRRRVARPTRVTVVFRLR